MRFKFEKTSLVSKSEIQRVGNKLFLEITRIKEALKKEYTTNYASINLPKDNDLLKTVQKTIKEKQKLKPTALVVIGIGGSSLGTIAIHEALNGRFYNQKNPKTKIYFADTVDNDSISDILKLLEKEKNILINVVTKSGTTTETIANFEVFLGMIKKYKKDFHKYVVVSTDKNSKLWNLAKKENFTLLEIPKKVGGRYSVFSAVSLFPLGLIGINIKNLLNGAQSIIKDCTNHKVLANPAALSAIISYVHYKNKRNINNQFIFSTDLESVGKWYRQLLAESIGKNQNVGITPTVSIGSTDLHSVAQLYLAGPRDKLTNFITIKDKNKIKIQGKSFSFIREAILKGTKISFQKNKRPFTEITIKEKSAFSIAQYLQFKMIEVIYLGCLLNVNPFDQPAVENYKKETRKIL